MSAEDAQLDALLTSAAAGDAAAAARLFDLHREQLLRMVRLRLDRRLKGKLESAGVVDLIVREAARLLPEFLQRRATTFYVWLRFVAGQTLMQVHREQLADADSALDVSLYKRAMPVATTMSLAAQFLGSMTASFQAVTRIEAQVRLQEALNSMEAMDREVLVLRHFEEMSNAEIAQMLEIAPSAAMKRYLRALKQLSQIANTTPGLKGKLPRGGV